MQSIYNKLISFPLCFPTFTNCVTNLRLTLVSRWSHQWCPVRISFSMEMQFLCQNLEDSYSPKSFSSSQIKLSESKRFSLNKFHIWQYLPIVPQLLGGLCFRCFLTFYPASLYDIWPYMFSFCKYSRGISIDRNNLCAHMCTSVYIHIYICTKTDAYLWDVYVHTQTHTKATPQRTVVEWIPPGKQVFKNYTYFRKMAWEPSL